MKKNKFIIALFLILLCGKTIAQKNTPAIIAIAFYNMENLFDYIDDPKNPGDDEFTPNGAYHYTEEVYNQKLHNLATVLQKLGTDVTPNGAALIGCCEIENDKVLEDLTVQPEIAGRHYKFIHYDSPDERGIDVALVYNPLYFTVLSSKPLPVNLQGTGGKETTRDVLYVCGILAGDTVNVFVNHWPSRRGGEEASASKRSIAAWVDRHTIDSLLAVNPHSKIIVMGDFNDNPTNQSVEKVLGAKADRAEVKQTDLYNPWVKIYKSGMGTITFDDKWELFDQIIFSDEWLKNNHWSYFKSEIFNKQFLTIQTGPQKGYPHRSYDGNTWLNGYSDHFPVVAYLVNRK